MNRSLLANQDDLSAMDGVGGVYIYRLKAAGKVLTRKMSLLQ